MDASIRKAAFDWLSSQSELNSGVFSRGQLSRGFEYAGEYIKLVGPKGIFKPKSLDSPLSITTIADGPYDDSIGTDDLLHYRYRGNDPNHPDNVGLRELMRTRKPLIYFHALMPGRYYALWPVYVVGDDPNALTFSVAVDDHNLARLAASESTDRIADDTETSIRRRYITATARQRVHQAAFRERILEAYQEQCTLCRLRHRELLDAAHIIPDLEEGGEPVVPNGLALCTLHHTAYDAFFLSIRPDYVIEIRRDVMEEVDGPVLKHALQGLHGKSIELPRRAAHRPDRERLEVRHQRFLEAGR